MLRKNQERQEQTCWSIFTNALSQINPMKALVWYLIFTSSLAKADKAIYLRKNSSPEPYFFKVPKDTLVRVTDASCKLISGDINDKAIGDETHFLSQVCNQNEEIMTFSTPREQVKAKAFEGQSFKNGVLNYEESIWDEATKIYSARQVQFDLTDKDQIVVTRKP